MKKFLLNLFLLGGMALTPAWAQTKYSSEMDLDAVRSVVNDAIDWQRENMPSRGREMWNVPYRGWADGVFLSAVSDWARYDRNRTLLDWCRSIGEKNYWEPGPRSLNPANDIAVSLMYANCWLENPRERYVVEKVDRWDMEMVKALYGGWTELIPTIERLDYQIANCPKTPSLDFEIPQAHERWCWCDALYMGAPVYVQYYLITGEKRYLKFMEREFWATIKALYDPAERLVYRDTRFIPMREKNGAKVFWGRGNGWVVGALARVMTLLPENHPSWKRYANLFQEMMSRIVTLQDPDGYWHTSLLDYEHYTSPETSCTGFFTYALWWGINRGLLPEDTYLEPARKAWKAMVNAVHPNGMLGYVQSIGDAPENVSYDKNEVYGTAALALAGMEVGRYIQSH